MTKIREGNNKMFFFIGDKLQDYISYASAGCCGWKK